MEPHVFPHVSPRHPAPALLPYSSCLVDTNNYLVISRQIVTKGLWLWTVWLKVDRFHTCSGKSYKMHFMVLSYKGTLVIYIELPTSSNNILLPCFDVWHLLYMNMNLVLTMHHNFHPFHTLVKIPVKLINFITICMTDTCSRSWYSQPT